MSAQPTKAASSPITGVVVGAGFFSQYQLEAWSRIRHVRIAAIADLDSARARKSAKQWSIPRTYDDVAEMLEREDADFIDIITQPPSHFPLIRLAAKHGLAVLCQKPFSVSFRQAQSMVAFCERKKIRLMINENWRWQAWYQEIRRLLDAGRLGEPTNFRFHMRSFDGAGPRPYSRQPYFQRSAGFCWKRPLFTFSTRSGFWGGISSRSIARHAA